jgi:hypothetical protein
MLGTLETLSQNLVASLNASRVAEALTTAHPPAKAAATATAATLQQAATPSATTRTSDRAVDRDRERDRTRSADPRRDRDNDDRISVQLSAAATRLTQSGNAQPEPPPASVEMLRSLRRARDAKQEGPMEEAMKSLRADLVKVFRMFGKSEKEALEAAEAVTGKARDASTRGPMGTRPSAGGEASTSVSVVFQSVTLQVSGESGKIQASIEIIRMEASMTTGAALAAGLPGGNQPGGAGQIPSQAPAPGGDGGGGGDTRQVDPLVFDLDGNGVNLSSAENGVYFDMDADGARDKTAWVSGGDALLALDRNGNGRIDDGSELFGEQNGARDGFAELARFDQDGSGSIDAKDNIFNSLILLHADGGMSRLRDEGITGIKLDIAIGLKAPAEQQRLDGGVIASQSEFTRTDGSRGTVADVLFDVKV